MIHVVTNENMHLYDDALIQSHRLRHEIYIIERGWEGLQVRDGLEYDQFDDDSTIHILAIEDGVVIGGTRLYPTTKNSILKEVCPDLASIRGIPSSPYIYEITRIHAAKEKRASGRFATPVIGQIFVAALTFALEEGISELSVQFEAWWMPRLQQMGWKLYPLGLPTLIRDDWWIAATIPIDAQTIRKTRAFYNIDYDVLVRKGLTRAVIQDAA
jgi:acyl-homoserine lactone synthase